MRKLVLSIFATLLVGSINAQQVFFQESFEDTTGWTASHLFDDGCGDYVLNDFVDTINARSCNSFDIIGADSTHILAFEDLNSGDPGSNPTTGEVTITIDSVYIHGAQGLSLDLAAAANPTSGRYDKALNDFGGGSGNGDTVAVQVKIDGGNWTKVMYFCADSAGAGNQSNTGPLYYDSNMNYDGGDVAADIALDDTLTDFNTSIAGSGSYISVRTIVRVESGSEEFMLDNIRLSATTAPCNMPTSVSTSNIDTNSADISWTSGGASNAVIEYGSTGFTLGQGTQVSVTSSPYTLTGLSPATAYEFYIKDSCSATSTSLWSGPYSFSTISNTCAAPSSITPATILDTSILFGWTTGGASAANIQYGATGFSLGSGTMVMNVTGTVYTINGLMPSTSYDIYVQDTCGPISGASSWVGPLTVTTRTAPSVVSATPVSATVIEVVFSDSMDVNTATDVSNYSIGIPINNINLNASLDTASLNLASPLSNGSLTNIQIIDNILSAFNIALDTTYSFDFLWNSSTPAIMITEIMYNDLSSFDTLEFIEIYNDGFVPATLGGMTFDQGFDFTFPAGATLASGAYMVIARDSAALDQAFSVSATYEWTGGSLSNSGEDILIVNTVGDTVDYVLYDDRNDWDYQSDGYGTSHVLCDPATDNNDPANWWRETNRLNGHRTSPGAANTCWPANYMPPARDIATIETVDSEGVLDSLNERAALTGVVFTPDYDGNNGYSFYMYDSTGGINIFNFSDVSNYSTPTVGDSITAYGILIQFNGLAELRVDSITVLDSNVALKDPAVVTTLDESTEGEYIRLKDVYLADTSDWRTSGSFNIDIVTPNMDTLAMRIDSDMDITDDWTSAPKGTFDLTGVGGQFDGTAPYLSGYQIYPRFSSDIDTSVCLVPSSVNVDAVDSTEADLSWMGASTADIEYGVSGFTPGTGMVITGVSSPYTLTGLSDTTAYEFYVRQICATKNSDWEGPYSFTTLANTVSIKVVRSTSNFKVFPNPVNGDLVQFNRVANVRVMDVLGNFLLSQEKTKHLDVSELSSGVYFIVESEGNMIKLVVE